MFIGILLIILVASPIAVAALSLTTWSAKVATVSNLISGITCFSCGVLLVIANAISPNEHVFLGKYIMTDHLSAWVLLCTGTVYALASIYSIGYIKHYKEEKRLPLYYSLLAGFALVMILGAIMNNLILYWISIDFTTIVSTFLVCYERSKESTEASWKYLIIVIAGLSLSVLGLIIFQWGGTLVNPNFDLTWSGLKSVAPLMEIHIFVIGFIFVLVGFATKVGLAPMHTWLPDAHSEGPVPASAMLSGALLNTAMLSLVRFVSIMDQTSLGILGHTLLVILGALSLLVAGLFLSSQTLVKRLMAYSSLEHMGVIAIGFGFGGVLGVAGAMYHMINHSLNKSMMFFGCGNAMCAYDTKYMADIRGILKVFPKSSILWFLGAVAITGAPPGALFLSEFTILRAGFLTDNSWAAFFMLVMLIIIFCAFMKHFFAMYQGEPNIPTKAKNFKLSGWHFFPMLIALSALFVFGFWWPEGFWNYFVNTANFLGAK